MALARTRIRIKVRRFTSSTFGGRVKTGGEIGIRTREEVNPLTHLAGGRFRPLSHLSARGHYTFRLRRDWFLRREMQIESAVRRNSLGSGDGVASEPQLRVLRLVVIPSLRGIETSHCSRQETTRFLVPRNHKLWV